MLISGMQLPYQGSYKEFKQDTDAVNLVLSHCQHSLCVTWRNAYINTARHLDPQYDSSDRITLNFLQSVKVDFHKVIEKGLLHRYLFSDSEDLFLYMVDDSYFKVVSLKNCPLEREICAFFPPDAINKEYLCHQLDLFVLTFLSGYKQFDFFLKQSIATCYKKYDSLYLHLV